MSPLYDAYKLYASDKRTNELNQFLTYEDILFAILPPDSREPIKLLLGFRRHMWEGVIADVTNTGRIWLPCPASKDNSHNIYFLCDITF